MKEKILVLHVKNGYEDRETHINQMMKEKDLPFSFILDGDMSDLTEETIREKFTGSVMDKVSPQTSCTMKHLFAYQYILDHQLKGALILEDDMVLYDNFVEVFEDCMNELERKAWQNALVSFEDSTLHFVPRSERRKGQFLYPKGKDRYAGAYYCTNDAARLILDYVASNKCDRPIDLFHTALIQRAGLNYLWCHPCIATQGTHTGLFVSSISQKSAKRQNYRRMTWQLKLLYKKALYFLR